jgi:hypothetical protein
LAGVAGHLNGVDFPGNYYLYSYFVFVCRKRNPILRARMPIAISIPG